MDTNIIVLLVIINNLNLMDDDNKRHLSSWFVCINKDCDKPVRGMKPKKCEKCQGRDYYHTKQAKKGLKSRRYNK